MSAFHLAFMSFFLSLIASSLGAIPIFGWLRARSAQRISEFAPEGHRAKQGTPTMGGLISLPGLVVGILAFLEPESLSVGALALLTGFVLVGFADDCLVPQLTTKRGLGWKQKLVAQAIFAALALALAGVRDSSALFWGAFLILFTSNAYNFVDGLDGLAGVIGIGLCVLLLAAGFSYSNGLAIVVAAVTAGSLIPFLFANAPPAKVFMGDVGSLPIGALLGYATVGLLLGSNPTPGLVPALLIGGLVLFVELVPVALQITWVKLFKRRLFPFTPIHHAFEKAGWPESRVVWSFALCQLIAILLAIWYMHLGAVHP